MTIFMCDARRQVENILTYASALGDVALVNRHNATIELKVGSEVDARFVAAARAADYDVGRWNDITDDATDSACDPSAANHELPTK
jgi:hypothetical protein